MEMGEYVHSSEFEGITVIWVFWTFHAKGQQLKKKKKLCWWGEIESFCTEDIIKFAVSKAERDVPERMTRVSVGASKPSDSNAVLKKQLKQTQ